MLPALLPSGAVSLPLLFSRGARLASEGPYSHEEQ